MPSGDHAGEMIGSLEDSTVCAIGAIRIRHLQHETVAALGDVGDARGEYARLAGQLLDR